MATWCFGSMLARPPSGGNDIPKGAAMKTIVCAVDGSESAADALQFAIELCKDTGAALTAVAVRVHPPAGRSGSIPVVPIEEHAGTRKIVDDAVATIAASGVEAHGVVADGDPAEEITAAAQAHGADMIVVGSRGLGAVAGVLMGSVSRALVKRSPMPVTVVAHAATRHPAAV